MTAKSRTEQAADTPREDKRPTIEERIDKAKQEASKGDHGDNPVVDVHGLPIPGDPQLLPGEVQTVGGPVTDDGGRVRQHDSKLPPAGKSPS